MSWARWADDELAAIRRDGRWRSPRDLDATGPEGSLVDGGASRSVVSFASNDYLGLTRHPAVVAAAHEALDRWGTGAGAARLIVGSRPVHSQLESALAEWKGAEAAAVFPTGFMANLGVLSAFGGPGVRIVSDELNHASIIDGCRLARAESVVYPHRDVDRVAAVVGEGRRSIVVTDTVFSMDGDVAPVEALADVCAGSGALLVLDEAHAVLGPHPDLDGVEYLRVGTLSKTLGALGGFVAGPRRFVDVVVNRARPYIFTTAPTPAAAAAALAALEVTQSAEGAELIGRLRANVERIAPGHPSPIVPIVLGSEDRAMSASAELLDRGLLVPAIRPPTVAPGTSRLRLALSAAHTDEHLDRLERALEELGVGSGAVA